MHGIYSIKSAITNNTYFSLPINRGFTRLSTIYFSLIDDGTQKEAVYYPNASLAGVATSDTSVDTFEW